MTTRAHISLKTKLAAALGELFKIPYEHAKAMTEDQMLSLVNWDHYPIPKNADGPDTHFNLVPRLIAAHREKTSKVDRPAFDKGRRLRRIHADHQANMAAKGEPRERRTGARIRSRNNLRNRYPCGDCHRRFRTPAELAEHVARRHAHLLASRSEARE